jgi:hypothetical protein
VKTAGVYRSGYSDQQLMEIADKMYASEHNDKDFMLKNIWNVVRHERKWSAYVKKIIGTRKTYQQWWNYKEGRSDKFER